MVEIYAIVGLVTAIIALLVCNLDKNFDKFVHDQSNGQIEFSSLDRIRVPLFLGLIWPYVIYKIIRKATHG
jgi:hypothetical protein